MVTVKIKKLHDEAVVPRYMTTHAAGVDLHAVLDEPLELVPGQRILVPTGLAMEIPDGYEGQVRPRSGLALKKGISVVNTPGTIDADYRGEIGIIIINLSDQDFEVVDGERICQMVINKVEKVNWMEVEDLEASQRGSGGFGHTGNQ